MAEDNQEQTAGEKLEEDNDNLVQEFLEDSEGGRPSDISGKRRKPTNLLNSLRANGNSFGAETGDDALESAQEAKELSDGYAQESRQKERTMQELREEMNEQLSQSLDPIARNLLSTKGWASEISDDLLYEKDTDRGSHGEDDFGLLSYIEQEAGRAEELGEQVATKIASIDRKKDEREELKEEIEELEEERSDAVVRAQDEEDDFYPHEIEDAGLEEDEVSEFIDATQDSVDSKYTNEIEEIEEEVADVDDEISSLLERKDERIEQRDSHLENVDEAYDPYANEVEGYISTATDSLEQSLEILEETAEITVPDLSGEFKEQVLDDAENGLAELKFETALQVAQRSKRVHDSVTSAYEEIERIEAELPEGYREDQERLDRMQEEIDDLAGSYDSFDDRVVSALETADSEYGFHDATEDLRQALQGIAHAEEE